MQYMTVGLSTTLIGIVLVTAILTLIAFIINSIHYLPFISGGDKKKADAPVEVPVESKPVSAGEPDYLQDRELLAVITAAVSESMNIPMDKLEVRSIRRSGASS